MIRVVFVKKESIPTEEYIVHSVPGNKLLGQVAKDEGKWKFYPNVGTLLETWFTADCLRDIAMLMDNISKQQTPCSNCKESTTSLHFGEGFNYRCAKCGADKSLSDYYFWEATKGHNKK